MRIIAFTGMPGSGKTEAVRLAREADLPVIRMGDFVMQEIEARGLPMTEEQIGPVATGMRQTHGPDIWARRTIDAVRARGDDDPVIVIDGVRSPAEIACFRSGLGADFRLIAIRAPDAIRHARILGRGRGDDAATLADIAARDARERGWGIEQAIALADETIPNETSLEVLQSAIRRSLERHIAAA